ncbi:hypothetical protein MLD38_020974 [Melastoma candidum]|uniref:Uncharacterized protein n=1 Tax=Melastoma candidum TaxID=119954 RepID=A0ACB9QMP6_9MYRT|nr:hypothetical protein MLD38_020974 [Melastoma candidum]
MSAYSSLVLLFLAFLTSPSSTTYAYRLGDVQSWCRKTPYPQPCEYFLSNDGKSSPIARKSDFLRISLELALEHAFHAHGHASSLGYECRNAREKVAWSDCLELYDHAIHRLNLTIGRKCTQEDTQTWLSAALTGLQTCRDGFAELGVADHVLPMMSNNVSKLISNALAMNYVPYSGPKYGQWFPSWLKPLERKLLQSSSSSSPKANVIVAGDGSGNYRTIQGALNAASKRKGSSRYVIYIKAGTYKENIEVGKSLKNIMFIGDGMGKTIITGSKSVGGGSTTFSSATVAVTGDGFIARDITIRNTAGAANHQAVALRSVSNFKIIK